VRRNGRTVDRAPRVDQRTAVGELRQQLLDAVIEAEPALLHEHERAGGDDRLRHRRDAKDAVAGHRGRLVTGQPPSNPGLDLPVPRHQPGHAADATALDVGRHDITQPLQAPRFERAHALVTSRSAGTHRSDG
jgi:hypothetical protein